MQNPLTPPTDLPNLGWRILSLTDLPALVELSQACYQNDGGLSFLFVPDIIQERYFPDHPGQAVGAFLPGGRLAASAAVHLISAPARLTARITGQVHPDLRGQGIGTYLMRWSIAQAPELLPQDGTPPAVMQVATESLTEPARRLYSAHGFANTFEELVMCRDLRQPLPEMPLPADVTFDEWRTGLEMEFFQAYQDAFRERPGFPGYTAEEWIGGTRDDDLCTECSLLVRVDGDPAGFVISDITPSSDPPGGYIVQIGVVPAHRRRGLASALLLESMRRMQAKGAAQALLTVNVNNPGAALTYERLGFVTVGRRARFEKKAEG